jgi:hypothetical protein
MRIHLGNKTSLVLILMAGASLVSMLATLGIDRIVHHDLYYYGLQFSTQWAVPYWTMAGVVFSMGWLIILTSIVFELHLAMHRLPRPPELEPPIPPPEPIQNEVPKMEAESTGEPEEKQMMTTALAVKKEEDNLSEFRVHLEEILVMTSATVTRQKAEDKPRNE